MTSRSPESALDRLAFATTRTGSKSDRIPFFSCADLSVECFRGTGDERQQCEQQLLARGFPLPLPHRCAWARAQRAADSWFLGVRGTDGWQGGFALEVIRSRALPGHLILRAERFGHGLSAAVREISIAALTQLACENSRILRIHVEVFHRGQTDREALASSLRAHGFQRLNASRRYPETITIDLRRDESDILAALHPTARRHIRAVGKKPVVLGLIEQEAFVPRMAALYRETMSRTGGTSPDRNWASVIGLSREYPTASRLVGLFRTDISGPDALLAFAWGCGHGDHAHYSTAASTRNSDLRMPLAYALVWDLLCWAKRNGASWFDFGGITAGGVDSEDRLGGISDFKRYFSKEVVTVGDEWLLEPSWVRGRLAQAISTCAAWVSQVGLALFRQADACFPPSSGIR